MFLRLFGGLGFKVKKEVLNWFVQLLEKVWIAHL